MAQPALAVPVINSLTQATTCYECIAELGGDSTSIAQTAGTCDFGTTKPCSRCSHIGRDCSWIPSGLDLSSINARWQTWCRLQRRVATEGPRGGRAGVVTRAFLAMRQTFNDEVVPRMTLLARRYETAEVQRTSLRAASRTAVTPPSEHRRRATPGLLAGTLPPPPSFNLVPNPQAQGPPRLPLLQILPASSTRPRPPDLQRCGICRRSTHADELLPNRDHVNLVCISCKEDFLKAQGLANAQRAAHRRQTQYNTQQTRQDIMRDLMSQNIEPSEAIAFDAFALITLDTFDDPTAPVDEDSE